LPHLAQSQEGGGGAEECAEAVGTMSGQLNAACCQTADCSTGPLPSCAYTHLCAVPRQPFRDIRFVVFS
jgi:hypothetical protein